MSASLLSVCSLVCTVICLLVCALVCGTSAIVVNTRFGALRGITTILDNNVHVDTFYTIPFARPPVGDLRFQKPAASEAWNGTRDATTPGPHCPQHPYLLGVANPHIAVSGHEDCLYLNVHTPKHGGRPLPVMVWIHGGAFYMGSGVDYDGRQLASNGVVVVTINYRLGALGFLSTQDGSSPGNFGLLDQVLALQWVRDVISSFNGDPSDVTIFGESAGSVYVSLLVESGLANGLFHKAIMESGVSLSPWAVSLPGMEAQPLTIATSLASRLGCPTGDSTRLVACLKTKDTTSIVQLQAQLEIENGLRMNFRPVVESTFGQSGFLAATPTVTLNSGSFNNVTLIRGFTSDEEGQMLYMTGDMLTMEQFRNFTRHFVTANVMKTYPHLDVDRTVDMLVDVYATSQGVTDPSKLRDVFVQMNSDFDFYAPTLRESDVYYQAEGRTQYLYRFSFRSPHRQLPVWMGVPHADDLMYVFGYPLTNLTLFPNFVSTWTDDDKTIAQQMMTWWTNFAKYGNPAPDGSTGPAWLPWTQASSRYLDINSQTAMADFPQSAANFLLWNNVIPNMATQGQVVG